jgi:predicted enzyme related to lactoylglutathione lyase
MNPVNWFEIPAKDLARAKDFYAHVFKAQFQHMEMGPAAMEMFASEQGAPGAGGALITTEGYTPSHAGTVVYFLVDDIEGTCSRAAAKGGHILVPKMSIGEFGFIAQFEDCEGNRIGLHSMQ